jgi:hypothetical protein
VYFNWFPLSATVPCCGWVKLRMLSVSPASGADESFASTGMSTDWSSSTVAVSPPAVGRSLTDTTLMVTVPVAVPPLPSEIV